MELCWWLHWNIMEIIRSERDKKTIERKLSLPNKTLLLQFPSLKAVGHCHAIDAYSLGIKFMRFHWICSIRQLGTKHTAKKTYSRRTDEIEYASSNNNNDLFLKIPQWNNNVYTYNITPSTTNTTELKMCNSENEMPRMAFQTEQH